MNVTLPTTIRELHTTAAIAEWSNSIYSPVFAALLITLGRVGDMFGPRRSAGFVLFGLLATVGLPNPREARAESGA